MKVGVFTALYSALPLPQVVERLAGLGVETVELGTGNYPGAAHCPPDELLASPERRRSLLEDIAGHGLAISALSQHGNPLHPVDEVAAAAHATWRRTLELAEALEVPTVVGFSGCPGDESGATRPNWVTCAWPDDFAETLAWQWRERVIPYWSREVEVAASHGVRVAIEPHPGFVVYDTKTLLELRAAAGTGLGANYDPSHLFWQGIDPATAVHELGDAIFHVHAKDTHLDPRLVRSRGVLETASFSEHERRSWNFSTVGDGHPEETWRAIVQALAGVGYDGALSIEHEDPLLGKDEGLAKAVAFLQPLLAAQPT